MSHKYSKIILAAGTGHIGKILADHFLPLTKELIILTRGKSMTKNGIRYLNWNGKTSGDWASFLENADVLINLAGKNVNCRYNEKNRKEIFDSRTHSVEALAEACKSLNLKPKLWIQCSSSTIYRHAEDRPMTETNGEMGDGFSVEVCKKWEKTFHDFTKEFSDTRKIILRTSLVLGKTEGVYPRLRRLVKFGLGGKQGNGRQMVSWIHEEDIVGIVDFIVNHSEVNGAINCTAPNPIKNSEFMNLLMKSLKVKIGVPAPKWLLELGAVMIGTETELILKSRWVLPEKIQTAGYQFKFADADKAFENLR